MIRTQRIIYYVTLVVVIAITGCTTTRKTERTSGTIVSEPTLKESKAKQIQEEWFGDKYFTEAPWVRRVSSPVKVTDGLNGRHLSLWASHGRYFKLSTGQWAWQRPSLYGTNEDLLTQTIVVPYLIPMLEKAGGVVFTPRERDWQKNEIVIDNDRIHSYQCEADGKITLAMGANGMYQEIGKWKTTPNVTGFAVPNEGTMMDGEEPFKRGTVRQTNTSRDHATAFVEYSPRFTEEGDYAVYVSYKTIPESVNDAHYTVFHGNEQTEFCVNQKMGGGTWVYLGTFHFTTNPQHMNGVVVDNHSQYRGKITTDAVRFGGGIGNIARCDTIGEPRTSGLPRCLEGARYYCQWAGANYQDYSQREGKDDYADDINCRSMVTNWLAGGSHFNPDTTGLNVPIELSLAFHTDAGYRSDFRSIYGSLGIVTTDFNGGRLASGQPRSKSRELIDGMLESVSKDMKRIYGKWNVRDVYDRNYSETRRPVMASTILEMLSHQSFPDMKLAHDPNFKFNIARAIYKSVLKYEAKAHGKDYTVAPLTPHAFGMTLDKIGTLKLHWEDTPDTLEEKAKTTGYVLYIAKGTNDYDNGRVVKSNTVSLRLDSCVQYRFKVASVNSGGESFATEELAAYYNPGKPRAIVVNNFHRLSSPHVRDVVTGDDYIDGAGNRLCGFDIDEDPGVTYGKTMGWLGRQQVFDTSKRAGEGPDAVGYTDTSLAGKIIAGNDFNYATTHVRAIARSGQFSVVSASSDAIVQENALDDYRFVDVIQGNERNDGYSMYRKPSYGKALRNVLMHYYGPLFISGSYIASGAEEGEERRFVADRLHIAPDGIARDTTETIHGMGKVFEAYRMLNEKHYASTATDVLQPLDGAFTVLALENEKPVATAYRNMVFAMSIPFECIKKENDRNEIMNAIIRYLVKSE